MMKLIKQAKSNACISIYNALLIIIEQLSETELIRLISNVRYRIEFNNELLKVYSASSHIERKIGLENWLYLNSNNYSKLKATVKLYEHIFEQNTNILNIPLYKDLIFRLIENL